MEAEDLESDHLEALPALQRFDIRIPLHVWGIGFEDPAFENIPLPGDDCGEYEAGSEEHKQCVCEQDENCPDVIYWFHPDHLGSSTFLTDVAGEPYQFVMYLPFGETFTEQRAAGFGTPYLFNAKELDEETGLYYYGARYYDPRVSMWWGVDPLAVKFPSESCYLYTMNNPIRYIDPTGMSKEDIIIVGTPEYQKQVMDALVNIASKSKAGYDLVQNAINSDKDFVIAEISNEVDISNGVSKPSNSYSVLALNLDQATADLDPSNGRNGNSLSQTLESHLAHELSHFDNGFPGGSVLIDKNGYSLGVLADEVYAVEMENRVRSDMGLQTRTHYGGVNVGGKSAYQSGDNPLGFRMQDSKERYQNSAIPSGKLFNFSKELRKNYSISPGTRLDPLLSNPRNSKYQLRLHGN